MADINDPKIQKILKSKAFAYLATIGPKGEPQVSPMWFQWDGEHIKFTHTTERQKYRNIERDPHVSVAIADLDVPYNYAEFRGVVDKIEKDPTGAYYDELAVYYDSPTRYIGDPRVILYVKVEHVVGQFLS